MGNYLVNNSVTQGGEESVLVETPKILNVVQPLSIKAWMVKKHSLFFPLKSILVEDLLWRKEHPLVPALICFEEDHSCHCPSGCVQKFFIRVMWLFYTYSELEQIFVIFNRDEMSLDRKISSKSSSPDIKDKVFKSKVPRLKVLYMNRRSGEQMFPYRIFSVNFDSLSLVLRTADEILIDAPLNIW